MPSLVVNRGLQVIAGRASNTADAFAQIQTLSVDDSTTAFAATDTALNSSGTVTNQTDIAFDSTPTRSGQVVTHRATIPAAAGNFVIRRIALHNAAAASVTTSSATLVAGVDGQSLTKTSDFSITFTVTLTYSV